MMKVDLLWRIRVQISGNEPLLLHARQLGLTKNEMIENRSNQIQV